MSDELSPARKRQRLAEAKGRRLERAIRGYLEGQGWTVETAHKVVKWLVNDAGKKYPRSLRHDLFSVWDGVAVQRGANGERVTMFYQVTTWHHVSDKRSKISEHGFPVTDHDVIFGYVGTPGEWRCVRGPLFAMPGEGLPRIPIWKSKPKQEKRWCDAYPR